MNAALLGVFQVTLFCPGPRRTNGVIDTDGKWKKSSIIKVLIILLGHLSLVLLTPVANLPPVSLILVANLPPVSLIEVVHLDLRISPRIFLKI